MQGGLTCSPPPRVLAYLGAAAATLCGHERALGHLGDARATGSEGGRDGGKLLCHFPAIADASIASCLILSASSLGGEFRLG